MALAAVPWGLSAREFIIMMVGMLGIVAGALVTIICVAFNAWRDRGIAKFTARKAEDLRAAPPTAAQRQGKAHPPRSTPPLMSAAHEQRNRGLFSGLLRPGPERTTPRGKVSMPVDRGRTPEPMPVPQSVQRVSAVAGQNVDQTRLDLAPIPPTEEKS